MIVPGSTPDRLTQLNSAPRCYSHTTCLYNLRSGFGSVEVETSPQKFIKRPVTVGLADGLNIEIRSGLTLKDKVRAGRL